MENLSCCLLRKGFVFLVIFLGVILLFSLFSRGNVVLAGCDGNQSCGVNGQVCVPAGCVSNVDDPCTCTTECQSDGTTVGCTGTTEAVCSLDRCASQSKCQVSSGCVWTAPTSTPAPTSTLAPTSTPTPTSAPCTPNATECVGSRFSPENLCLLQR